MNHFVCMSVFLSVILFLKTLYSTTYNILQIYLENIKSFKLENKNILSLKKIKSRLCLYINLDFSQFHLISALRIYELMKYICLQ